MTHAKILFWQFLAGEETCLIIHIHHWPENFYNLRFGVCINKVLQWRTANEN